MYDRHGELPAPVQWSGVLAKSIQSEQMMLTDA